MRKVRRAVALAVAAIGSTAALLLTTAAPAAAASTIVLSAYGGHVSVCKKPIDSIYGPLWEVHVTAFSLPGSASRVDWYTIRDNTTVVGHVFKSTWVSNSAWPGGTATGITWASRLVNDTWLYQAAVFSKSSPGPGKIDDGSYDEIANCLAPGPTPV